MTFSPNWQYRIVGSTTKQQDVVNAINTAMIPKTVTFTYNPNMPIKYAPWDGRYPTKQIWPWSLVDWGMVVVDAATIPDIAYGGGTPGKNCTVARWSWEDAWTIGNRIWHEISHAMGLNSDMLNWNTAGNDCARFCTYAMNDTRWKNNFDIRTFCYYKSNSLISNSVLQAYYTMLWEQAGFTKSPVSPSPSPTPAPTPVPTPAITTNTLRIRTITDYSTNANSPYVKISIVYSGGSGSVQSDQNGAANIVIPCGIPVTITTLSAKGTITHFPAMTFTCSGGISTTLACGA